ncbi:MAG: hypothetical protein AAGL08_21145, partial [Cyanobacteria bacterium J06573_11]
MSILSEQSVTAHGPQSSEHDLSKDPMQLGPTALPNQSTSELQNDGTASAPLVNPLPKIAPEIGTEIRPEIGPEIEPGIASETMQQQRSLQRLCQNADLYSGDLNKAASILTQATANILSIERVSLWFY